MAATESIRKMMSRFLLVGAFLFLQNCSVDLATTTPGAQSVSCSPTTAQLNAFQLVMIDTLQTTGLVGTKQGCGNCHISGPGAGSFKVLAGTTSDIVLANYCSALSRASVIAIHPTQPTHAQVYSPSDITELSAWVASL